MDRPGPLLIAAGVVIVAFSLLIDTLGIGKSGFGWHQIVGIVVGVVIAIVGIAMTMREPGSPSSGS